MATSGPDLLVTAYLALTAEEQAESFQRIRELRLREEAGNESAGSRFATAMRKVTEALGHPPTIGEYKAVQPELAAAGVSVTVSRQAGPRSPPAR